MFYWFKKHFIPHEGNEHRPHILRGIGTRNVIAIILFVEIFTFLLPIISRINITDNMAAVLSSVLSDLTNEERQVQNLPTLKVSSILNQVAENKAKDMATKGYFAHTSPEGKTPWYWLKQVGYKYQYAGENLAINFIDSKDVTDAWMASPTHRANIVKGNYTEVGTGIATGIYEGHETVFVAQVYANPMPKTEVNQNIKTEIKDTKVATQVDSNQQIVNVLGEETVLNTEGVSLDKVQQTTFLQRLLSSPRNTTNIIFYIVFGIIVIALLLYIFIKARNHHIDLITNGLIIIAILGAIFLANYYYSKKNMIILDSFDYSN